MSQPEPLSRRSGFPDWSEVQRELVWHLEAQGRSASHVGQGSPQRDYGEALRLGLMDGPTWGRARAGVRGWNYAGD